MSDAGGSILRSQQLDGFERPQIWGTVLKASNRQALRTNSDREAPETQATWTRGFSCVEQVPPAAAAEK